MTVHRLSPNAARGALWTVKEKPSRGWTQRTMLISRDQITRSAWVGSTFSSPRRRCYASLEETAPKEFSGTLEEARTETYQTDQPCRQASTSSPAPGLSLGGSPRDRRVHHVQQAQELTRESTSSFPPTCSRGAPLFVGTHPQFARKSRDERGSERQV